MSELLTAQEQDARPSSRTAQDLEAQREALSGSRMIVDPVVDLQVPVTDEPMPDASPEPDEEPVGMRRFERELADMRAGNARTLEDLARQGVALDPLIVALRVETLLDGMLGGAVDGNDQRTLFEHAFNVRLTELVARAASDVAEQRRRAILTGAPIGARRG